MHIFDYSFLKNISLPANLLTLTNSIYKLKEIEKNKLELNPKLFLKLNEIAIVQSIKSSNAIEGIYSTDERIKEIVEKKTEPLNHNEAEIAGYRDALDFIHNNYEYLSFNKETVLRLHEILLSHTNISDRGVYKKRDNVIREIRNDGTSLIRWNPTSSKDTSEAMDQLFLSYLDASNDYEINDLLLIPSVILDFLCIHPFSDGNGRMSRLLSLLLLYKSGFDIPKYISYEEQINKYKGSYYEALKNSSYAWHENNSNYIYFIENFILMLFYCYNELETRYLVLDSKKYKKYERVEKLIDNSIIPISKKEISEILLDVSPTTIELVLSNLVKEGKIKKIGTNKNAKYIKLK